MNIWNTAAQRLISAPRCSVSWYERASIGALGRQRFSSTKSTPGDEALTPEPRPATESSNQRVKAKKKKKLSKKIDVVAYEKAIQSQSVHGNILETLLRLDEGTSSVGKGWGRDELQPNAKPLEAINSFPTSLRVVNHEPTKHEKGHKNVELEGSATPRPKPPKKKRLSKEHNSYPQPPHIPTTLPYTRRVEGFLNPTDQPILQDLPPSSQHRPIATLAHGLERVLFNPGVHWLQDPRSRVYNFSPYLENIPKVTDFAFERLAGFIRSSRDQDLWELAKKENRTYAGSTSSLSGMLSQIYFLISDNKGVDTSTLSRAFAQEARNFTPGQRMPASVVWNYQDGIYAIDSGSGGPDDSNKNILTWMGTLLEKYLTMTPEEFATYTRSKAPVQDVDEDGMREAYRYAKSERFVMRSQLDCKDERLPGTGVFDIKTRACLPIRMDIFNFEENSGYLIRSQHGIIESFEKEYYDLVRSAFLKYSFQVRIGNMDGVIVAYHNTARMFGFQYIPLEEMDERLFGKSPGVGDRVFNKCISLLESIAEEITGCFPHESIKCTFETEEGSEKMNIWVEPLVWESEEKRPLVQIQVTTQNFLGQQPVRGSTAVTRSGEFWTVHWALTKLSGEGVDVAANLAEAKQRQFRAHAIPTGVDDIQEFYENLNFGGQGVSGGGAMFEEGNFRPPSKNIERLREVSRLGREETERLALQETGKPKWVLGMSEPILPPPREEAELLPPRVE